MFTISVPVESDGISHEIEEVVLHPQYNHQAYNDVAVIKLKPSEGKQNHFNEIAIIAQEKYIEFNTWTKISSK